jgi:hypothetical protein
MTAYFRTALRSRSYYAMTASECVEKLVATRGKPIEARAALMAELSPSISVAISSNDQAHTISGGGKVREFSLQHMDEEGGVTRVAIALVAAWPRGATKGPDGVVDQKKRGLILNIACNPALPLCTAGGALVTESLATLREEGCDELSGIARLEGLCEHILADDTWRGRVKEMDVEGFDEDMAEAVEAIARGVPRKGHSVLGQGTFTAGRPAFEALAWHFAQTQRDPDAEITCLRDFVGGAKLAGINWMHDTSPEAMKASGGCTAALSFPAPVNSESQ